METLPAMPMRGEDVPVTIACDDGVVLLVPGRGSSPGPAAALVEPSPASHALAPWRVELVDGRVVMGGFELDPSIARDLWMRLGAVLGEGERDREHAAYQALAAELDRRFTAGVVARGRTRESPSVAVSGVLVVESDTRAALRIATYSVALLRLRGGAWEGEVQDVRPDALGRPAFFPAGVRVRLDAEAVAPPKAPLAMTGPVSAGRPAAPPAKPTMVPAIEARRQAALSRREAVLGALGPEGGAGTLDSLAKALALPRAELRAVLDGLVEDRRVQFVAGTADVAPSWRRCPDTDWRLGQLPPSRASATRLVRARRGKRSRATAPPPPPPPELVLLACHPCRRTVKVPRAAVAGARCRVCGCDMQVER